MKPKFFDKYGPWALVTEASSGLGEEFCRQLADQGFNLVMVARREGKLQSLSEKLQLQHRIKTRVVPLDLTAPNSVSVIQEKTLDLEIGLLINNAGFATTGPFLEHTLEEESSLLYLNCLVPLQLSHSFGSKMAKRGRGGIINVSSAAGFLPMPYWSNYAASKAYLLHFSEGLTFEFKDKGIDVLTLCPGATRTEFAHVAKVNDGGMKPSHVIESGLKALGEKSVMIPGVGNRLVVFLCRFLPRKILAQMGCRAVISKIKSHNNGIVS